MINLYTDGAARGNPGPGGYGVVLKSGKHYKELSGGFSHTTNNRMELLAVITGLEAIKRSNSEICVFSDSSYVCDAINKGWLFGWEKKNFDKKKNPDLWIRFLNVYRRHKVKFVWIKGHAGHTENERCDQLAVEASLKKDLPADSGYVAIISECNPDSSAMAQNLPL
ncbi:MAG: ribonuclease HI [Bacteroidetes bacterium GWF2_40_14]|nr:MAG: ribonuclease HI [Bacteroidetes bacterium GWF2_40_14]